MSIFPYIYYMILSFNITSSDNEIAIYAGMVTSAFAFAEFSSGVVWGRLSDRIGRKPVLVGGLAGTGLSMVIFGFAPNLPVALVGRALGGLLNGNIGVLQTTVAEMITVKEHQPRAYSIMPFVWCLGSILGPALGGALAQPCLSYPSVFPRGTIFDRFPFLLPNLICAVILACGVTIGILFLEETHQELKDRRDYGLEAGKWLLRPFRREPERFPIVDKDAEGSCDEANSLLGDELPPGYRTTDGSPRIPSSRTPSPMKAEADARRKPRAAQKAFTKQVILNIIGYGLLAHSISFDQLMPVFLSEKVSHVPASLPFKFVGGFAMPTKDIGVMMAIQGAYSMIATIFFFPIVVQRFGSLATFRFVVMSWPILYFLVPYLVFLPERLQYGGIFSCLMWKITAQVLAFPAMTILITNSAPSMMVLGLINGVAASIASLARAFGPTLSGIIHAWGLEMGYAGLAWWASGLICIIAAVESLWMTEAAGRMDAVDVVEEESRVEEAFLDPHAIDAAINAATTPDKAKIGRDPPPPT
ncbi:hypothetical protein MMC26_003996 [Xylographa opegraphella]|nr:hypothetical protein [Xylographa opegraphella]